MMRWWLLQRGCFWVCWVLWRITSPQALVVAYLLLGTLAMAQREALHEELTALHVWLTEQNPSPSPIPDPTAAEMDRVIAAGVMAATALYWLLAELVLDLFHDLLHAATAQMRGRRT